MLKIRQKEAPVLPEKRTKELLLFQKENDLNYKDILLLHNAFVHSSFANEAKNPLVIDNERLEFLGDSVLSVVVSTWLYNNISKDEGECTRIRSVVVSEDALSRIANDLGTDRFLLIGHGEELTGGRHKKAILADCMEAIFASLYLDQGFEAATNFILKLLVPVIEEVLSNNYKKDYKTMLQEYVQKTYKKVPFYTLVSSSGPDHNQVFYYSVSFHNKTYGPVSGHNKKDAEQNVAKLAWQELGFDL